MARTSQRPEPVLDVYWRPGCPFCLRLRQSLFAERVPVRWHNIWRDPAAAEFVRSVADGNETVPTVVLAGQAQVNPPPGELRATLRSAHRDATRFGSRFSAWWDFQRHRGN
jgi:glutaredoxin